MIYLELEQGSFRSVEMVKGLYFRHRWHVSETEREPLLLLSFFFLDSEVER